jgi:protein O-GlcNAc transferase
LSSVVALRGRTHAGRMTASVLTAVGLSELAADSAEVYARAAVKLAGDLPALAELRAGPGGRLGASPPCDGLAFTRGLKVAYRLMRRWCERPR